MALWQENNVENGSNQSHLRRTCCVDKDTNDTAMNVRQIAFKTNYVATCFGFWCLGKGQSCCSWGLIWMFIREHDKGTHLNGETWPNAMAGLGIDADVLFLWQLEQTCQLTYTHHNSYWSGLFKIIVCTRVIDVDQNMDQCRSMWINVDRCGSI